MTVRSSQLDSNLGNPDAAPGSQEWITYFVRRAKIASKELESDIDSLQGLLDKLNRHGAWKARGYLSFETFCTEELELDAAVVRSILNAPKGTKVGAVIQSARELQQGERTDLKTALLPNVHKLPRGNTRARLAARLKKLDDPEISRRIEAGEFKSVYAAAKAAGIVKEKPLTQLKYWWKKASHAERAQFKKEIDV